MANFDLFAGRRARMSRTAGALLAVFLGLCACNDKKGDSASAVTTTSAKTIAVTVDSKGFTPNAIEVKKGETTQLVFTRTTDSTCAKEVVFPEIDLKKELPLNKAVAVDVPVDSARTLTFQCGMGMYKSKVVIQ